MKKIYSLLTIIFIYATTNAQGVWTAKATFGGAARHAAASFSIGTKGYIGTGTIGASGLQDFWEWDQVTNTWTQKANFGGAGRYYATGFAIGAKGYIGLGRNPGAANDFWEYDPGTNSWLQKANFPGGGRWAAVGFSVGNYGYLGTGFDGGVCYKDFYEYNPANNTWTQRANVGGITRELATGFSIGTKGYIGGGYDWVTSSGMQDFWEFDPAGNIWTQKSNYGGGIRFGASGFSIGTKGYIGTGVDNGYSNRNDYWEWDQGTNAWVQVANYAGGVMQVATGFSVGLKGYEGTGNNGSPVQTFYEYINCNGTPTQPGSISGFVTVCQGTTNTYSVTAVAGASSYTWTLPGGWSGTSVTNSINATASATSGNITVTANNACGSSVAQSLSVTVNPIYNISANSAICQGDSILLAGSYQKTTGNYTDLFQSINGCDSTVITALTVNPLPTVTLGNQNAACMNAPAFALSGGAPVGGTYSGVGVNNNQFDPAVAGAGTHTITYSYSDPNTGCGNSSTNTIVVNPLPTVTLGAFTAVCADAAAFALTGGLPAGGTYSGVGVNNNQFDAAVAGAGTHTITYTYTDGNTGCSNSTTNTIVVNPLPPTPIINVNGTTFTSSAASGNQWYLNGNPINGATNQTFVCTVNGNYTVCVTDANGCKSCSAVLSFNEVGVNEDRSVADVIVYPNPFITEITLKLSKGSARAIIYNTLGEVIYSNLLTTQPLTINSNEVPIGIYFLQIQLEKGTITKKIIKQ